MQTNLKRALVGGALVLTLVGGGAVAFADTQQAPPQNGIQTFLDDVASHLGVQPSALQSAIQAAELDRLNQALQSGKITQQQYDSMKSRIDSGKLGFLGMGGHGRHGRGPGMAVGGMLNSAATYLGMTPQDLRAKLQAGQTLAQVTASVPGKNVQDLESAILAPVQTRLNAAVQSGKLTQDQANARLAALKTRLDKAVNQSWQGRTHKAPAPGNVTPQS